MENKTNKYEMPELRSFNNSDWECFAGAETGATIAYIDVDEEFDIVAICDCNGIQFSFNNYDEQLEETTEFNYDLTTNNQLIAEAIYLKIKTDITKFKYDIDFKENLVNMLKSFGFTNAY